jgi:hypothetical protein
MMTVEFVGGPLDGHQTTLLSHNALLKEVVVDGDTYGILDMYESRDDMYLLYGHIERMVRHDAAA